jgi:hypothetical protein
LRESILSCPRRREGERERGREGERERAERSCYVVYSNYLQFTAFINSLLITFLTFGISSITRLASKSSRTMVVIKGLNKTPQMTGSSGNDQNMKNLVRTAPDVIRAR